MISDAYIDITCDECHDCSQIELEYKYTDFSGRGGHYDASDSAVRIEAESEGYIFKDDKHYCSQECQDKSGFIF